MIRKEIKFNSVEVTYTEKDDGKISRICAISRSSQGQGWEIPLRDMSPNDLRRLATVIESLGIKPNETLPKHGY